MNPRTNDTSGFATTTDKSLVTKLVRGALILALVSAISSLSTWYSVDRVGMLASLCEAGLPNITRPAELDAEEVECRILEKKQRYFGSAIEGGGSGITIKSKDLARRDLARGFVVDTALLRCRDNDCGEQLEQKLAETTVSVCVEGVEPLRFAGVVVTGWVTTREYEFGHLGITASRFLYVDRVVDVFDPPHSLVSEWRKGRAASAACQNAAQ